MALESDYAGRVRSYTFKASLLMLTSPKLPIPYPINVLFTENPGCWFLCSNSLPTHLEKAHKLREIKIIKT